MISHHHAKANNRYVPNYNPSQPSRHVTYLDANNLYGWEMSQALPVGGFRWLEKEEFEHLNINSVSDDSKMAIYWKLTSISHRNSMIFKMNIH